jgi:hypothetical protein
MPKDSAQALHFLDTQNSPNQLQATDYKCLIHSVANQLHTATAEDSVQVATGGSQGVSQRFSS